MTPRVRCRRCAAALLACLALGSVLGACRKSEQSEARCASLAASLETSTRLELRSGGALNARGEVTSGTPSGCAGKEAARFATALSALSAIPLELRPSRLCVEVLDPRSGVVGLEFDEKSGAILAAGEALPEVAWVHELFHVSSRGPRPDSLIARRLFSALDEGVADYFAGAFSGSAELTPSGRSLARPPALQASDWALLGVPRAPFDAHRFGGPLASQLYHEDPRGSRWPAVLLACLRQGYSSVEGGVDSPRRFVDQLVGACPESSRQAVMALLERWLPAPLIGR